MVSGVRGLCFPGFCGYVERIDFGENMLCMSCLYDMPKRTIGSVSRIPCFAPFLPSRSFQVLLLFFFSETQALTVNCYIGLNTMACVK